MVKRLSFNSDNINLQKLFDDSNIEVIGITPDSVLLKDYLDFEHYSKGAHEHLWDRGAEILEWLKDHPEVDNYVAIDDDTCDIEPYTKNFVHTSFRAGLRKPEADLAIAILNNEDNIEELRKRCRNDKDKLVAAYDKLNAKLAHLKGVKNYD